MWDEGAGKPGVFEGCRKNWAFRVQLRAVSKVAGDLEVAGPDRLESRPFERR